MDIRAILYTQQQHIARRLAGAALIDRIGAVDRTVANDVWLPLVEAQTTLLRQITLVATAGSVRPQPATVGATGRDAAVLAAMTGVVPRA